MVRTARAWQPSGVYHVDARAHSGAPIFALDEDREFLVERAARVFREEGVTCLGWSVLVNHYHLLLRVPGPPGHAMQRLNTALARRVRRTSRGDGAVFQGRYFSGLCTDESATLARLGYVVANPVHHRVVPTIHALLSYRWSSLGELLGLRESKLVDPCATLSMLHPDEEVARRGLLSNLESQARMWAERTDHTDEDEPPLPTLKISRRLPDGLRARQTPRSVTGRPPAALTGETVAERRAALVAEGWTVDLLARAACAAVGCDVADLLSRRMTRGASRARAIVAHVACDRLDWPGRDVAAATGVTGAAVSHARRSGAVALAALGVSAEELVATSRSERAV